MPIVAYTINLSPFELKIDFTVVPNLPSKAASLKNLNAFNNLGQELRHHLQVGGAADRQKLSESLNHPQHQITPAGLQQAEGCRGVRHQRVSVALTVSPAGEAGMSAASLDDVF